MIKSMTLAYFSGTGCTEMIADCFEQQLTERGIRVTKINITSGSVYEAIASDYLLVLSPVYAFRLVELVEQWIGRLPQIQGTEAAVISVSGGGEISPNTACRVRCKGLLAKKGYRVTYEKMLVMPSNFAKPTYQYLVPQLIKIIPHKVNLILDDILSGKENLTKPKTQDRFYAAFGRMEHFGARFFGASIRASDACNHCGLCSKNCPKDNIKMRNGMPKFGFRCMSLTPVIANQEMGFQTALCGRV